MKYEVTLKETEIYILEVEVDGDEVEAIDKAWKMLSDNGNDHRTEYHSDTESDAEAEAIYDE